MVAYCKKRRNGEKDNKVLAIVSVFDPDGIVDDYVIFYLKSLKNVVDRLIVAVNGKLTNQGRAELKKVTNEIHRRPNTGFDFGAYKDVIENYLRPGELEYYGTLVLCNDTCYGPLIPFVDIFAQKKAEPPEFWSINYVDDPLLPHFQSYFMVARGRAINLIIDFLHREVDCEITEMMLAHGYEHGLSELILSSGIKTDYYTSCAVGKHDIDIFGAPDYAIKELGFPLVKRRAFSEEFIHQGNCWETLKIIREQSVYPVQYIIEHVKRVYHVDLATKMENVTTPAMGTFEKNYVSRQEVIEFCKKHRKIYLYGNGYMSILFMARFGRYIENFIGYVVSDEYYSNTICRGNRIYPLSQIGKDEPLIIALMKKSAIQVVDKVKDRRNVLFLSIEPCKSNILDNKEKDHEL